MFRTAHKSSKESSSHDNHFIQMFKMGILVKYTLKYATLNPLLKSTSIRQVIKLQQNEIFLWIKITLKTTAWKYVSFLNYLNNSRIT